jgi:hypothetical protein
VEKGLSRDYKGAGDEAIIWLAAVNKAPRKIVDFSGNPRRKAVEMDRQGRDVVAIVKKLKDRARASPWIPAGVPPQEHYHHLPNGLHLCLTMDILPKWFVNQFARAIGVKVPEELGEGGQFWHLSIARLGAGGPRPEEIEFWRRAFFEEEPVIEVPGILTGVNSRHFFWRAE